MNRIGTSYLPVIMDKSPFMTKKEYWLQLKGLLDKPSQTFGMKRGVLFEDDIIAIVEDEYHLRISTTDELFEKEYANFVLVCKIDGYVDREQKVVVEVKLSNRNPAEVFDIYYPQVMGELMILRNEGFADYAYLIVADLRKLFDASSVEDCIKMFMVEYDEVAANNIVHTVASFVNSLELDECPYEDLYVVNEDEIVITIDGLDELGAEYDRVLLEIEELKKYSNAVKKKMEALANGRDYIRGRKYGLKKIRYVSNGCVEIPFENERILKELNIPYKVKPSKEVNYYKLVKLKEAGL